MRVTILIVDDEPIRRRGIALLLNDVNGLTVVGEAASGDEALTLVGKSDPDLVVSELLPNVVGFDFIEELGHRSRPAVLIFTQADELIYAPRAVRLGARGFVLKSEPPEVLLKAIAAIAAGGSYVSDRLANHLVKEAVFGESGPEKSPIDRLSDRQLEVFELIGQCWTNREIAERLHLSIKTVNVHRANIREKLDLHGSRELTQLAVEWVGRHKYARSA